MLFKKASNFWFQVLGDCFNPYNDLWSLYTRFFLHVWILQVVPCKSPLQSHHWKTQFWHPFDESSCLQWPLVQGYNKLTQTLQHVQKFYCNWLQMFGWNLLPQVWPYVWFHHEPHVWFWTPICKKWASYPWEVARRSKCCWQPESHIILAWQSPTSLRLCLSMLLPWFEVLPKKLWWPIQPSWWQPTNHEVILYIVFGAFSLRPSCCGSFKPSSCGEANSSSEEKFDVYSSPSTSSVGLSFKDIGSTSLTSSSSCWGF